jgi:pilus assembly protein TadC
MLCLALYGHWRVVKRRGVKAEIDPGLEDSLGHSASLQGYHLPDSCWAIASIWIAVVLAVWIFCYGFWLESSDVDFYARTIGALILAAGGPFFLSLLALGGTALAKHFLAESEQQEEEYSKIYLIFVLSLYLSMLLFLLIMFPGKMIIEKIGS